MDADVLIDVLRSHPPAVNWLRTLRDTELGVPGLVAFELYVGCRNKAETHRVDRLVRTYPVVWPTHDDCERALNRFPVLRLRDGLGMADALIAETAIGLRATLLTFNRKHFRSVRGLKTMQPYIKLRAAPNEESRG